MGFNATSLHLCIHFISPSLEAVPPAARQESRVQTFHIDFQYNIAASLLGPV